MTTRHLSVKNAIVAVGVLAFFVVGETSAFALGNTTGQEYGDAVYRKLTSPPSWLGLNYNHAGLFAGQSDGVKRCIEAATLIGDTTIDNSFSGSFSGYGSDYYGAFQLSNRTLTFSQRKSIMATAKQVADAYIYYTVFSALDPITSTRPVTISNIDNLRCDGVVEYCYEWNNFQSWWHTSYPNRWDISLYPAEHNDAPDATVNPDTEESPWSQRGAPAGGSDGPVFGGANPNNAYLRNSAVTAFPTYLTPSYSRINATTIDVTITATDESGIAYIGYEMPGSSTWSYTDWQVQHPTSASFAYVIRITSAGTLYYFAEDNGGNSPASAPGVSFYTISSSAGSGGTISPSGSVLVPYGQSYAFAASPNANYTVDKWYVDGSAVQIGGNSYTLSNAQANRSIQVTFSYVAPQYTITASAGSGGNISPSGSFSKTTGSSQAFTASPNANYVVNQWLVDSGVVQNGGSVYTLSNIQANRSVQVTFTYVAPQYTITASAGSGGSISPSGSFSKTAGSSQAFTANPNANYVVNQWLVDGGVVQNGGSVLTLSNIQANHGVQVTFTLSSLPVLEVTPKHQPVTTNSGLTTFSVSNAGSGNLNWAASITAGGSWARITSGASGVNAGTITVWYDANPAGGARTCTVQVVAAGASGSPQIVTLAQAANSVVNTPQILHSFGASGDGNMPLAGLMLVGDTLYGTTDSGGVGGSGFGTVFKMTKDGSNYAVLHQFAGGTQDGVYPRGLATDGTWLYGTTQGGGSSDYGILYRVGMNGENFAVLHSFTGGSDGVLPGRTLLITGGMLYGMARRGGANNSGVAFRCGMDGAGYTIIHIFMGGASDGALSESGFVRYGDQLYGTTVIGGSYNKGVVFRMGMDGAGYENIHSFAGSPDDGMNPAGLLSIVGNMLYGTAAADGTAMQGTLFRMSMDGSGYTTLRNFGSESHEGSTPHNGVTLVGSRLYGTTYYGGFSNLGVVFSCDTNGGAFRIEHSFSGGVADGANPSYGTIVSDGSNLYGVTSEGGQFSPGTANGGVLYRLTVAQPTNPPVGPRISGTVTRSDTKAVTAGITLAFSGVGSVTSDDSGYYSMTVPSGWSGTASASYSSGGFAKSSLTFRAVGKDQMKKNFVWSPDPTIIGTVTRSDSNKVGRAGVIITFSNLAGVVTGCTTTDVSGGYTKVVPYGWSGKSTASFVDGGFAQPVLNYKNVINNQARKNYVWSPDPTITGKVVDNGTKAGKAGVPILVSGRESVTTDGAGNYAATVPYGWTGTLTPVAGSGTFSPAVRRFTKLAISQKNMKFTWLPPRTLAVPVGQVRLIGMPPEADGPMAHIVGSVRWDGAGAALLTERIEWAVITLADGVLQAEYPVAPGADISLQLEPAPPATKEWPVGPLKLALMYRDGEVVIEPRENVQTVAGEIEMERSRDVVRLRLDLLVRGDPSPARSAK